LIETLAPLTHGLFCLTQIKSLSITFRHFTPSPSFMAPHNRHTQNSPRQQQRRQRPSAHSQETPPIDLEDLDSQWPPIEDFSNETPAQREERLAHDREAKRISDEIDAQLEAEKTERRKRRPDIRIILLGKFLSSLAHSHFLISPS